MSFSPALYNYNPVSLSTPDCFTPTIYFYAPRVISTEVSLPLRASERSGEIWPAKLRVNTLKRKKADESKNKKNNH